MKRTVYVCRGLSGSGKSTVAKMLKQHIESIEPSRPGSCEIISNDDRFVKDGVYTFDSSRLKETHTQTYQMFLDALIKSPGYRAIIVDNTNSQKWEYEHYISAAREADWEVQVIIVGQPKDEEHVKLCIARNQHNVPAETIRSMSRRFQL